MTPRFSNALRSRRLGRQWSQAELAARAGVSRTAISAIEKDRLAPSVTAALSLARALECTVEQLFGQSTAPSNAPDWAWPPTSPSCRYWQAEVGGRRLRYPVEPTSVGAVPHDGLWDGQSVREASAAPAEQVLVIATCDPAVGLLAAEYARQTPFRMLPLTRSSRAALRLMADRKVHVAGVHLSPSNRRGGNAAIVRETCQDNAQLLRIGVWQAGIALSTHLKLNSTRAILASRLKWVGREPGSGARQCLDELLAGRKAPRRVAPDHRGVALAIRCGWADAGVCLRLTSEEAGLGFVEVRRETYDLCFMQAEQNDPRLRALADVVQSPRYRQLLRALPGYDVRTTGELAGC